MSERSKYIQHGWNSQEPITVAKMNNIESIVPSVIAPEYSTELNYVPGDYVTCRGVLYKCKNNTTGNFNENDWDEAWITGKSEFDGQDEGWPNLTADILNMISSENSNWTERVSDLEFNVSDIKSAVNNLESGSLSATNAKLGEAPIADGNGTWAWKKTGAKSDDMVQLQRVFRIISSINNGQMLGQCIAYTGNSFLLGGPSIDDTSQRIIETNMSGIIQSGRDVTFTSNDLGHMNDLVYYNGKIYTITRAKINIIDYTTLEYEGSITLTAESNIGNTFGISVDDNGNFYVLGYYSSDGGARRRIFSVNMNTGVLTLQCTYVPPTVYNGINTVNQGFSVHDGYAYCVYNRDNHVLRIRLNTGEIVNIYRFDNGDGHYPTGEVENCAFINGQMYIISSLYMANESYRTQFIAQVFKTDIGGITIQSNEYGQAEDTYSYIYVDGNATGNNPNGRDTNPFNSLEEACLVYQYQYRFGAINPIGIDVSNGEVMNGQCMILKNVSVRAHMGGVTLGALQLRGVNGILTSFTATTGYISHCDLIMTGFTITTLTSMVGSKLYGSGSIKTINNFEKSILSDLSQSSIIDRKSSINLNNCNGEIILNRAWFNEVTISLDNHYTIYFSPNYQLVKAKLWSLTTDFFFRFIVGDGTIDSSALCTVRFTSANLTTWKNGTNVTRYTRATAVDTNGEQYYLGIEIRLAPSYIRFDLTKFLKLSDGSSMPTNQTTQLRNISIVY